MKKKIILLSLLMLLPLGGLIASRYFYNDNNYSLAKAEIDKVIYVDMSLNNKFKEESAQPYLQYGNKNIALSLVDNDIYQSSESVGSDFIICAYDGSYKTNTISFSNDNYNYVCLSNYVEGEDISIKGYGYYSEKITNPGASYATQRIWLNNDNPYFIGEDEWGSQCVNAIGYYDNDKWNVIDMEHIQNSYDGRMYYYADVPYDITSINFMRMSSSDNHNYLVYLEKEITSIAYGSCYFAGLNSYEDYVNIDTRQVYNATATMLANVVEAFLTYGKSNSNGTVTTTVMALYSTWFAHKSASKEELKNIKIMDYTGYTANGNSYEGLVKNAYFSVNEKWNTMCSNAAVDPNTGQIRKTTFIEWIKANKMLILIIGISVIIILAAAFVFFLIRRKKRD